MSESRNTPISSNVKTPSNKLLTEELLENYSYLTIPVTTTALGFSVGGFYGALFGFGIGALDEGLHQYGYTDQRYLSSMFIGSGMFVSPEKTLLHNALATGLGSTFALTLSTGIPQQYPVIIQAAENAVLGGMVYGPYGAAAGITCAAIDVGLAHYNITSYTHCSSALKGSVFASFALPFIGGVGNAINFQSISFIANNPLIIPGLIGAYSAYSTTTEQQNTLPVLQLTQQLHDTCSSVMDKNEVSDVFEKLILVSAGLGIIVAKNKNTIFGIGKALENIPSGRPETAATIFSEIVKLSYYITGYAAANFVQGRLVNYFLYELQSKMEKSVYEELYRNETILKVQQIPNTEDQLDWVGGDILTSIQGLRTITSAISTYTTAIIAFPSIITNNALNIVGLTASYNYLTGQVTSHLAEITTNLWEGFIKGMSNISKVKKGMLRQSEDIILNNATELELSKMQSVAKDLREVDIARADQDTLVGTWNYVQSQFALPIILLKITTELSVPKLLELANANNQVVSMINWSYDNAPSIKLTELSINRFNKLIEMMRDKNIEPGNKIEYHTHHETSLVLDNLTFEYNQKTILTIDHLEFERGKIYAVTGKLGSGKSIVLKYGIFGIKHTGIDGSGNVTFPADKHLVFATQNDHVPLESTLYQVIMSSKTPAESSMLRDQYLNKVKTLMTELKVDVLIRELDTVRDWGKTLSGGQKKMIAVMKAILQEPKELLADEIFNGMDTPSIITAETIIKKYLPNTTIIIVDHHALDNNYLDNHNEFYNGGRVHFENGKVALMDIAPVNLPSTQAEDFTEQAMESYVVRPSGETLDEVNL